MSVARAAATWSARDLLDPAIVDVVERDPRPEGDGREDRHLRGGVRTRDVLRRIRLGVALLLRVPERVVVRLAGLHLRQDVVRRPVHDPEDAVHVRDHERLAQDLDHRDRRADARLEAELHARCGSSLEELGAAAGDELLVRRDHRLSGAKQLEDVVAGRVEAAHHLGDDADRGVVADVGELGRQHALGWLELALLVDVLYERADDPEPVPGRPLDVLGALGEEPCNCGSHRSVPQQGDRNVNRHSALRPAACASSAT